jgi:pSer/pThr/pTyr-binding forkhead associated (FHA) protein
VSRFARLICLSGPKSGTEYPLTAEITSVGRSSESTIVLDDAYASRQHAEIRFMDGAYLVHDLQSKNGVLVDGRRLSSGGTAWLSEGNEVQFASTLFRFLDPSATLTAPALTSLRESGLRIDTATRQVSVDGAQIDPPLSPKQFDLLLYLYNQRGRAVSKDEIAEAVWPEASGEIYDATIDRMISRLRSRLEVNAETEPRFIITVRGYGYQFVK